jgi:hypothetical protein
MYFGPFKWPSRSIWLSFLALAALVGFCVSLGIDTAPVLLAAGVVVLVVAARQRANAFSLDKTGRHHDDD